MSASIRRRLWFMTFVASTTVLTLMAFAGCDPVHESKIDALGGEAPGVPTGPTHRPGQPCLVCHGGRGPGGPQFAVAGTIYQTHDEKIPSVGTYVRTADAFGRSRTAITNEVGNFYITASEWQPVYPLFTSVCAPAGPGAPCNPNDPKTYAPMKTRIGREGSCAGCHFNPEGLDSAGHVFIPEADDAGPG